LQKGKPSALVSSRKRQPLLINPSIPHLVLQSTEGLFPNPFWGDEID
jgi:hypothetical protein